MRNEKMAMSNSSIHMPRIAARQDRALIDDVIAGLRKSPKEISPMWLYDERGSQLFDMICELPEYYPTRTEFAIMVNYGDEIAQAIGPDVAIIEFGSGTSLKTRLLLDHLEAPKAYVPVDIARIHLLEAAGAIAREYPSLSVIPLCADFSKPLALPRGVQDSARRVVYFPGSTLGNFERTAARALLKSVCELIGKQGALLIGIDLKKEVSVLERAYNDAAGITAKFNVNALRHLNRTLDADVPLPAFEHQAVWVEELSRIEMRLVARREMRIHIDGESIAIKRGEYVRTECCHKYTLESFSELAASAGLQVRQIWCDSNMQFSVQLLEPIDNVKPRDGSWFHKELTFFKDALKRLS
jgi:dimethylhistidine N-methyltransferase